MLRGVKDFAAGSHRRVFGGRLGGGRRNIFELEGDDADARGKTAHGVEIVIGSDDFEVGHLTGGRVGVGRKSVHAVAHAAGGDREHAAKLAAPENTDGRAGKNGLDHLRIVP